MVKVNTKAAAAALLCTVNLSHGFVLPSSPRGSLDVPSQVLMSTVESDAFAVESPQNAILKDQQSIDIARDLDGRPLSKEYFAEKMGIQNVESYTCPEEVAFRGLMSNACRVNLLPGGESAFYKRIIFGTLDHAREKMLTAPHKVIRDAKSYEVVASFLSSKACQAVTEKAGFTIPKCYDAKLEPNDSNPIESKFSFLLEDLAPEDGWYQEWLLQDIEDCEAALSTMAKIHAFFWNGSSFWDDEEAGRELEAAIWDSGSYVQPKSQNKDQCKNVAKGWATEKLKCEEDLSSFDYWENLGERLESMAEENGRLAHPFADGALSDSYKKWRTFTHGDPKSANLFFRRTAESEELEVGLIDFQWSGFGLAATDMAHFFTCGVHADRLVDGGEETLLQYYFDELQTYLVEYGAYDTADDASTNFSYETFIDQYEIGVLDICRIMIAYAWSRYERVEDGDEAGRDRSFNKTSYNKSVPCIVWLMTRCDEIMKSRGV